MLAETSVIVKALVPAACCAPKRHRRLVLGRNARWSANACCSPCAAGRLSEPTPRRCAMVSIDTRGLVPRLAAGDLADASRSVAIRRDRRAGYDTAGFQG